MQLWDGNDSGVLELPSGRCVRGRGLRQPTPLGPAPTLSIHLAGRRPPAPDHGDQEWIRWPDFWVPTDFDQAATILRDGYDRAVSERVEIACGGGVGRTGTALSAWGIFDGLSVTDAIDYVRRRYHPRAVEVPWQRRFLRSLTSTHRGHD